MYHQLIFQFKVKYLHLQLTATFFKHTTQPFLRAIDAKSDNEACELTAQKFVSIRSFAVL